MTTDLVARPTNLDAGLGLAPSDSSAATTTASGAPAQVVSGIPSSALASSDSGSANGHKDAGPADPTSSTRATATSTSSGVLGVLTLGSVQGAPPAFECTEGDLYARAREQGLSSFLSMAAMANITASLLRARPGVQPGLTVFAPSNAAMAQIMGGSLRNLTRSAWENVREKW